MQITAHVENWRGHHAATVATNGQEQALAIAPRVDGGGSSVNGGELLFLALATCYCNDLYREARKRGIDVARVQVEVAGDFAYEGCAASNIRLRAVVDAAAPREDILALMRRTDTIAEIQATVRQGVSVVLEHCEANAL
jgi:organic hydroperoxide reductase OsmC/OhrA